MPHRILPRANQIVPVLGALMLLAGCGFGADPDTTLRDVAIYKAVIIDLIDRSDVNFDSADQLPVVFVETLEVEDVPLEVQVEIVTDFEDRYQVRFIDHLDEAVKADLPDLPVRENSLLVGVGRITVDGSADVRGEWYLDAEMIEAYEYRLQRVVTGTWNIVGEPLSADPMGFVATP